MTSTLVNGNAYTAAHIVQSPDTLTDERSGSTQGDNMAKQASSSGVSAMNGQSAGAQASSGSNHAQGPLPNHSGQPGPSNRDAQGGLHTNRTASLSPTTSTFANAHAKSETIDLVTSPIDRKDHLPSDRRHSNASSLRSPQIATVTADLGEVLATPRMMKATASLSGQNANDSWSASSQRDPARVPMNAVHDLKTDEEEDLAGRQQFEWHGEGTLNAYIYDYLRRRNFANAAQAFAQDARVDPNQAVPIDSPQGLLFEWWTVFWDIFMARTGLAGSPAANMYVQAQQARQQQQQMARQQQAQAAPNMPFANASPASTPFAGQQPMPAQGQAVQPSLPPQQNGMALPPGMYTPAQRQQMQAAAAQQQQQQQYQQAQAVTMARMRAQHMAMAQRQAQEAQQRDQQRMQQPQQPTRNGPAAAQMPTPQSVSQQRPGLMPPPSGPVSQLNLAAGQQAQGARQGIHPTLEQSMVECGFGGQSFDRLAPYDRMMVTNHAHRLTAHAQHQQTYMNQQQAAMNAQRLGQTPIYQQPNLLPQNMSGQPFAPQMQMNRSNPLPGAPSPQAGSPYAGAMMPPNGPRAVTPGAGAGKKAPAKRGSTMEVKPNQSPKGRKRAKPSSESGRSEKGIERPDGSAATPGASSDIAMTPGSSHIQASPHQTSPASLQATLPHGRMSMPDHRKALDTLSVGVNASSRMIEERGQGINMGDSHAVAARKEAISHAQQLIRDQIDSYGNPSPATDDMRQGQDDQLSSDPQLAIYQQQQMQLQRQMEDVQQQSGAAQQHAAQISRGFPNDHASQVGDANGPAIPRLPAEYDRFQSMSTGQHNTQQQQQQRSAWDGQYSGFEGVDLPQTQGGQDPSTNMGAANLDDGTFDFQQFINEDGLTGTAFDH
ncbi:uncharacterized protein L969DRAFT_47203 [Mixia osmundae IAM 14324]|uniref:Uncharacterized protein n=1 Tax=Mixia osmundae (strain CBS 9802 / IAM 14324 / JCM 22182 / KY 12970) TaxID=764103 RepID=G7E9H6_MIXOS|nr:uncharacterized protein L969DRAFT_47203 [Mixia osmundae IAM 14324]KEI39927.1 hypothetical protein L969DRAFT_47203 [Mixia osmundae IAM 14324]GAA99295.1 hypothetical protein E5Q_05990 [Mixia osmundae IAM 14324]